ncbi:MAG TPA: anti-sigma factor [Nocardioidaceae bacterium]|nr:anti-sigma factor [Nocardioidaceae bacterium]
MNTELHTLSGAYALDALGQEEVEAFRTHLEQCQACRIEVAELQATAAELAASETATPPAALRARVLAAASREPQLPPEVRWISTARARRWMPRLLTAAAAVVVIVLAAVFGIGHLIGGEQPTMSAAASRVFHAGDAQTSTAHTSNGGVVTVAVSRQNGKMAVETDQLPSLGSAQTYQLWTVRAGTATSAGVVSDLSSGAAMPLPAAGTTVAITIEPAGGSRQPTTRPIVLIHPRQI